MARFVGVLVSLLVLLQAVAAPAAAQSACPPGESPRYVFGFADLHARLGDWMGDPLTCEFPDPNGTGDVHQQTTTGLAFWRKSTNTPTFTNGFEHWAITSSGLVYWTGASIDPPPVAQPTFPNPAAQVARESVATLAQGGWATVVDATTPESLRVRNADGNTFTVWHIGIIGAAEGQGDWRQRGTDEHARLLPPGARVWLEASPGLSNPREGIALRHVFREQDPHTPVAGALLQTGYVWVFPDAEHSYLETFANLQAEAVLAGAGGWGQSSSTTVFRPRGTTYGGIPTNPSALPALQALDRTDLGNDLLRQVNRFPVEVGVAPLPSGVLGAFSARVYSVQLTTDIMGADPDAVATVLLHELVHVQQMIREVASGEHVGCYAGEIEAFEATSQYWFSLHGPTGKSSITHPLDRELNATLRQYTLDGLTDRVLANYADTCVD